MHKPQNSNSPKLWHRLKELVAICFCVSLLSGCVINENVEVEILYAPQMHSHFDAGNAPVGIKSASIFIFNAQNILVKDTLLDETSLNSGETVEIIRGVREGTYHMLSFYNLGDLDMSQYTIGVTTAEDILISLPKPTPVPAPTPNASNKSKASASNVLVDSLCYTYVPFDVARGNKTVITAQVARAHYRVSLTITGLSRVTSDLGEITIQMLGIPSSINGKLGSQDSFSEFIPLTVVNEDERKGEYMSLVFDNENKASLKIYEGGMLVQTIVLSPEDYTDSDTSNLLDISIQFYANSYIIIINNWVLGEYEIVDMGS